MGICGYHGYRITIIQRTGNRIEQRSVGGKNGGDGVFSVVSGDKVLTVIPDGVARLGGP